MAEFEEDHLWEHVVSPVTFGGTLVIHLNNIIIIIVIIIMVMVSFKQHTWCFSSLVSLT